MNSPRNETKITRNGDATIGYIVIGSRSPSAATLCIIASTGRGPEDFMHLAGYLASSDLRIVLPWPRGGGPSQGSLENIDFHDLAKDAAVVLAAEAGKGGAFIVGHAYGCWIARTVAQDFPDLVDGLILLAAGGGKWPSALSRGIDVAMDTKAPTVERLAALRLGFFAEGNDPNEWLSGWHADLVVAQRAARTRTDRTSWWSGGTVPILDIVGLQDPFRPKDALEFYVQEFPSRVVLRTVDNASHALPDEKPEEVALIIVDWLNSFDIDGSP